MRGRADLRQVFVPAPPSSLRTEALGRVEALASHEAEQRSRLELIASSPAWWLGWAVAVALVLVCEPPRVERSTAERVREFSVAQIEALAAVPERAAEIEFGGRG